MFMVVYDKEYEDFLTALDFYADKIGVKAIAAEYKCTPNHIYPIIKREKNAGRKVQLKIANSCGFDTITDFIQSVKKTPKDNIVTIDDPEILKHFHVIKKFKNKNFARIVNEHLVEIESLDPGAFLEILTLISNKVNELKKPGGRQKPASGE